MRWLPSGSGVEIIDVPAVSDISLLVLFPDLLPYTPLGTDR
jgi:hypothetical protein